MKDIATAIHIRTSDNAYLGMFDVPTRFSLGSVFESLIFYYGDNMIVLPPHTTCLSATDPATSIPTIEWLRANYGDREKPRDKGTLI